MRHRRRYFTAVVALLTLIFGQIPAMTSSAWAADSSLAAPTATSATTLTVPSELRVGSTISLGLGTWSANPEPTFSYQWYACTNRVTAAAETLSAGCTAITGATATTFVPQTAQKSKYLLAAVVAKNSESAAAGVANFSASTEVVVTPAPLVKLSVLGAAGTIKFTAATTAKLNTKFAVNVKNWVTAKSYTYAWYRCDQQVTASASAPTGCVLTTNTAASYVVTASDVGRYVVPFVTALSGTTTVATARIASSGPTLQVPVLSTAPTIDNDDVVVGQTLIAQNGSWLADPNPTFTYQWYACSSAVAAASTKNAACAALSGQTANTLVTNDDLMNKFVMVQVNATNTANTGAPTASYSASTNKVLKAPVVSKVPTLSYASKATTGQPVVGGEISAKTGTWIGSPNPNTSKSIEWYLCTAPVAEGVTTKPDTCDVIAGETDYAVTAILAWQGKFVTFAETASNSVGSSKIFAEVQDSVQTKPIFSSDPTIAGLARSGQTLSATPNWSAVGGEPVAQYQWLDCAGAQSASAALASGCKVIAGETESTFTIGTNLEERFIAVRVTLENAAGTTIKYSATTAVVTGAAINLTATKPVASNGHARVGSPVNAGTTTWGGFPKPHLTVSWYRCDTPVSAKTAQIQSDCRLIAGANQNSYTPVAADSGKYLSVKTVATQDLEITNIWSPSSEQVFEAPSFDSPPSVGSQHVYQGTLLQTNSGLVRGFPEVSKTYVWYRCSAVVEADSTTVPSGCSIIAGATSSTYEFVSADVGKYVLTAVSITNDIGTAKRFSPTSAMVNSGPSNVSITAPSTGAAILKVGSTLTANDGVWTALPDPTFKYQWYRCGWQNQKSDAPQSGCNAISGATNKTYLLSIADAGQFLSVAVIATNPYASATVYSPSTTDVGEDIHFDDEPRLTSLRNKGDVITLLPLSIRGTPTPERTYRWLRCDNLVPAASEFLPANCVVIPKAVQATYTFTPADVTKYVALELTLKNRLGSVTRYTASSLQVLQLPEINGTLTVTGNQWLGKTLQAGNYSVTSFPATEPTIQWYRGTTPILGAVTPAYVLTELDVNSVIHYEITARNPVGIVTKQGGFTGIIGSPPRLLLGSFPVVCGLESDNEVGAGATVWTCPGSWQATPADIQYSYQWYLCTLPHTAAPDLVPADCALVKKQTDFEYQVAQKDERKFVAYQVVASNGTEDRTWMSATSARVYVKPRYLEKGDAKIVFQTGQAAKDGSPRVGYTIEATPGKWNGEITNVYTYQWFSCTQAVKQSLLDISDKCEEIYRADNSASSRVLSITSDLAGKYLGVQIIGSYKYNALTDNPDSSNRDYVYTSSTTKPVVEPPINVTPPRIVSRYPYVQATQTGTEGTWRGSGKLTQKQSWWVCDTQIVNPTLTQPVDCTKISDSQTGYKLALAQKDKFIALAVTSSNTAGETTMWAASTLETVSTGPVNTVSPKVSVVGAEFPSTLSDITVTDGSWVGDPTPSLSNYSWFRCENEVKVASEFRDSSCSLITLNASQKTYRPILADAGKFIVAAVTFSNGHDWVAYSSSTAAVDLPPNNLVSPSVEGSPFVGKAISVKVGTWDGSPPPTFERRWFACDTNPELPVVAKPDDCVAIADPKGKLEAYTPTVAELNKYLLVRVTGVNRVGQAIGWSNYTPAVVSGPVKVADPVFTFPNSLKNPLVGAQISTDGGTWQGTPIPSKSYTWMACEVAQKDGSETAPAAEAKCVDVPGGGTNTLIPSEDLRGKFLMIHVRAFNLHAPDGVDWYSATTTAVWMAPVIDHPVEVFGTTFNELRTKAKFDTWKAFPEVTREYLWYLCDDISLTSQATVPNSCEPITPKAATAIFKIPAATWNEDKRLVVRVVATNDAGTATTFSATSTPIKPGPVNKVSPVISGGTTFNLNAVNLITVTNGTWAPDDVEISYQWYRCGSVLSGDDELGEDCEVIPGANTKDYALALADPSKTLVVAVTGRNDIGASTIYSASTVKITEKVNNVEVPAVEGAPKVDTTVNGNEGVWRGFPAPGSKEVKRAWYACTSKQVAKIATKPGVGCSLLPNTNKTAFNIPDTATIIGKYLVYSVTKSNVVAGVTTTVKVFSASTEMVADPPVVTTDAVMSPPKDFGSADRPSVGTIWTVEARWKKPAPPLTYQWYSCEAEVTTAPASLEALPATCLPIAGAITSTYTIRLADRGKYFLASTTGTNSAGSATSFTKSYKDPVDQAPVADPLPVVTGDRSGGATLSVTAGTWTPQATVVAYRWFSCDQAVPNTLNELPKFCEQLDETGSTYVQDEAYDGGKYITVLVTGKFGKATTGYLIAVTAGTRVGPTIPATNRKPYLEYDSFLIGNFFTVNTGEWQGLPEPTKTYKWFRCTAAVDKSSSGPDAPTGCTVIPNETGSSYKATKDDDGKYLLAAEIGTNDSGSITYYTASSEDPMYAGFEPGSLVSVAADSLEIRPGASITITATPGTWSKPDGGAAVLVHRWVYCSRQITVTEQRFPVTCSPMFDLKPGKIVADEDTKPLVLDMSTRFAGYYIGSVEYVQKTGSPLNVDNPMNRETYRLSATTGKVLIAPSLWNAAAVSNPDNLPVSVPAGNGYQEPKLPTEAIVGVAVNLSQVSAWQADTDPYSDRALAKVTWRGVGSADGSFNYQWYRCATIQTTLSLTLPGGCVEISGATTSSYTPVAADVLSYLVLRVTGVNSVGTSSAYTKSTWHVTQRAANVVGGEPTISEVHQTGVSATVSPGDWVGETAPVLGYNWYLCPTAAFTSGCTSYTNANGRSFTIDTLGGRDRERYLVARVKGTNTPYLTSDTTYNIFRTWEAFAYAASERIYEAPYWSNGVLDSTAVIRPVTLLAGSSSSANNSLAANVGETLRMDAGVEKWNATPSVTSDSFTYSWYTCANKYVGVNSSPTPPSDCDVIPGQTANSLVLTEPLVGKQIMGRVETFNSYGVGVSYSATTAPVAQRPFNKTPPTMSFAPETSPVVDKLVTGAPGTWGGSTGISAVDTSYRWYSCNTAVAASASLQSGCTQIVTPSASSFTPTASERGKYIVYSLEVSNFINPGSTVAATRHYSAGVGPVQMDPKFDATDPKITGKAHVGQSLNVPVPSVTSYPDATTTWVWYSCATSYTSQTLASVPANCRQEGVANQSRLDVDDSMTGRYISVFAESVSRVVPTKKNSVFTLMVTKEPTNTAAPVISGTPVADGVNNLSGTPGTWVAMPSALTYSYAWYLCDEQVLTATKTKPAGCSATAVRAPTTTIGSLPLTRPMAGKYLVLAETASQSSNNLGSNLSVTHYSASTAVIKSPPAFSTAPTFSGTVHVGEVLTSAYAKQSAYDIDTTTYQWYACDTAVTVATSIATNGCALISNAINDTFTPTISQVGKYITVGVTLTNSVKALTNYAPSTAKWVTMTPVNTAPVTISSLTPLIVGGSVDATDGTWLSNAGFSKMYLWYACSSAQSVASSVVPADCTLVQNGATKSYRTTAQNRGKYILVAEKATNTSNKSGAGEAYSVSATRGPVQMAPVFTTDLTVSGTYHVGETLTATMPDVQAHPANGTTYQWLKCSNAVTTFANSVPNGCVAIDRSQNAALTLTTAEAGQFVVAIATNTNDHGSAVKTSVNTLAVTQSPENTAAPTLSGDPLVQSGNSVAVSAGAWSANPAVTIADYSYAWFTCTLAKSTAPTSVPGDCTQVANATASSLSPTDEMAGKFLIARVTVTVRSNKTGAGTASVFTTSIGKVRNKPQFGAANPTISGIAHLDETLTATLAATTGFEAPTSSYVWWQCSDAIVAGSADVSSSCTEISGSQDASFRIHAEQVGKRIVVVQTATNGQGSVVRSSASTLVVSATPTISSDPVISGADVFATGATVSVTKGVWNGSPAPSTGTLSYTWYTCTSPSAPADTLDASCTLATPTSTTISLTRDMDGKYLVARETITTSTNKPSTGSAKRFTAGFGPINVSATASVDPGMSAYTASTGTRLRATLGTWTSNTKPISYSYSWYACSSSVAAAANAVPTPSCSLISGFDSVDLVVPASVVGKYIMLAVTATNAGGKTVRTTKTTSLVTAATIAAARIGWIQ